ncbi:Tubulin-tyrosine ligase family protein [Oesophagostomum dentatum]|uniref:Tubulin-tyrosine ligase family protein n=1 Tax=Oesophagostomum dentatum TaxID=61180 RepID=A0A0B1SB86_OESDE|nr:Tubulin-tyrosine ligase family protein [Oesophagostomum dentatum]
MQIVDAAIWIKYNMLVHLPLIIVDESLFYIGYWGRHLKSNQYRALKPHQKVNHYPGAFHIGRKDRLWMHIEKQQRRFGENVYGIMPKTYLLPKDYEHMRNYLAASPSNHVIVKPPASARGTGISVTRKIKDIPDKTQLIAQHYLDRPLTINGAKFDLRLYAYVPSLEPLRIYIYEEGLVRFASVPWVSFLAYIVFLDSNFSLFIYWKFSFKVKGQIMVIAEYSACLVGQKDTL